MHRLFTLAAVMFCLALSSCVESDNPASDAAKGGQDKQLYGTWIAADQGASHVLTFGQYDVAKENWHTVIWTQLEKDKVQSFTMYGFVSEIGGKKYFNLANTGDPPAPPPKGQSLASIAKGYTIFHYECNGDRAVMRWHSMSAAAKKNVKTDGDRLTGSTEEVAKYLEEYGAKAFEKTALEFKRVKP